MAAIIKGNKKKNHSVLFFDDFSKALYYSNFGGKLVKVQSTQGSKHHGWIVVTENLSKFDFRHKEDPKYTESDLVNEDDYPSLNNDFIKAGFSSATFEKLGI